MDSFIDKVAKEILSGKYGKPAELAVVLPTRRAGLYFKKALGINAGRVIVSPDVFSIEDFIQEVYPGRIIDPTEALFILYSVQLDLKKEKTEPFEEFCHWARLFLSDIQEIDRYLVDAQQLFGNLKGIKELEEWSLNAEVLTPMQTNYLEFWHSLFDLYTGFKEKLRSESLAYEGMALRELVERDSLTIPWEHILIAGFNALTKSEEKLFKSFYQKGKATLLWDADIYYYSDPLHEAGKFLRTHIRDFKKEKEKPSWISDDLCTRTKKISITGVPGNTLQAKLAGSLLEQFEKDNSLKTAVILADESLLFPVLHAIPGSYEQINVSMGYPVKFTAVAGFIERILKLHEQAQRFGRKDKDGHYLFYFKNVTELLRQPVIRLFLASDAPVYSILQEIREKNKIFISRKFLLEHFTDTDKEFMADLLSMNERASVLATLEKFMERALELTESDSDSIEQEFYFEATRLISTIADYDKRFNYFRELKTLISFIRQAFNAASIPYYGEPLSGLQVMGMLETRCLDFDRIILLSANENILPSGRGHNSYIPFDLRKHFGLPTYQDRDAIFGYHFYRLIQRASEIHCIYTSVKDVLGSGEKSRYLTQLENELPSRNKNAIIKSGVLNIAPDPIRDSPIIIDKSEEVIRKVKELLKKGISPSAISSYVGCPLRFYFSKIAGIYEQDEVEEEVDARLMGTIVHSAIESLYKPLVAVTVAVAEVEMLMKNAPKALENAFLALFSKEEISHGQNMLAYEVAKGYLSKFLEWDAESVGSGQRAVRILEIEKNLSLEIGEGIVLKGICDRIDECGEQIRIIDYKTGKVDVKDLRIEGLEEVFSDIKKAKSLQLLCYALLYQPTNTTPKKLVSGIYSFRTNSSGLMTVEVNNTGYLDTEILNEFKVQLLCKLGELTDPAIPFIQTEDRKVCAYCDFRGICDR